MASTTDATLYDEGFEAWLATYREGLTGHVSEDWAVQRAQARLHEISHRTADISVFERPATGKPARTAQRREAA